MPSQDAISRCHRKVPSQDAISRCALRAPAGAGRHASPGRGRPYVQDGVEHSLEAPPPLDRVDAHGAPRRVPVGVLVEIDRAVPPKLLQIARQPESLEQVLELLRR
eukprot:4199475-Prymnesium_polylepis.1